MVRALSDTGSMLWNYSAGGNVFRGVAIADIDSNGILDVAFGCDDGILRALRGDNGHVIWTYNLQAHYGRTFEMDHAPVIADFNNDGKLDIFIIGGYGTSSQPNLNHGRAYALSAGNGVGPGWHMFRHDLRHSGSFYGFQSFLRGDANGDGVINSADVVYLINYLFLGGPAPQPLEAGDINSDGILNSADVVYLINYLFIGGPPPCK
jgi:hypothetical protein